MFFSTPTTQSEKKRAVMTEPANVTFVTSSNNEKVLKDNLLASPCLQDTAGVQILVQRGFSSASQAYNDAIDKSENDLIVFVHQDMIFPGSWLSQLKESIEVLEKTDPNWGVLGSYGETRERVGRGHIYSIGLGEIGKPANSPQPVQTLDEIVLILRKSSGLRFDPDFPHFHFYGADICMEAQKRGMTSYVISAYCVHNTQPSLFLPREYYQCYRYFRKKWLEYLPVQTTCLKVTKSNIPMYKRRLLETYMSILGRDAMPHKRVEDVPSLLKTLGILTERGTPTAQN